MKKLLCLAFISALLTLAGCSGVSAQASSHKYSTYKDIPGVTQADVDAIEALRDKRTGFVYGATLSAEAFAQEDGSIGGFAALLYGRLSELFGFEFTPYVCNWDELTEKIGSQEIDFTSEFTATPERLQKYFMTDAIIQRTLKLFTNTHNANLSDISNERVVKCAFISESTVYSLVASSWSIPFEPVFADDEYDAAALLISGEVDVYIDESVMEALFDTYDFIKSDDYYPLIYSPVSLTTANPGLEPIITVMQKYLNNGGFYELAELYNQGAWEYSSHKLSMILTDEEKAYILRHNSSNTAIAAACEPDNYPSGFYNVAEKEFQGIAIDTWKQVTALTGLRFVVGNNPDISWPDMMEGLENGTYSIISDLIKTKQREGHFIWADKPSYTDSYAMISRADYPDTDINQILFSKVGLLEGAAYTDVFLEWFPGSTNTVMYLTFDEAFTALENGEIDLFMATQYILLNLTNYLEKPGYKINIAFSYSSDSFFGFNKDEEILRSIVSKALRYINTEEIAARWQRKVFDYKSKMLRDMVPFYVVFVILLSAGFITSLYMFIKNRRINKNLERLVADRTSELALQTSTLTTMFESIPDLVFCKDLNLRFTRCNKSFEDYFKLLEQDILGKDDMEGLGLSYEDAEAFREADRAILRERKAVAVEEAIPSPNGESRLFETIKTPLMQNGEPVGIMGISRDITRRKAAEEEARIASRAKSDFLSSMSHEIRTPLNAIIGMLGIAMSGGGIEKINHCLDRADSASKHLLGVINNILDMSKIEADKFELDSREFKLEKMLMSVTNVTNFRAEEKNQTFIVNLDNNVPPSIVGDDLRLAQVITNLLTNAVKFTPEHGTVTLNIETAEEANDDITLRVVVADTGIGISAEQQRRLFTSFEQADGGIARKFGGTGLGLVISKRIVELMGGRIWIESELGHGSKFIFTIKAHRGTEKTQVSLSELINRNNLRVLAVDDSPEICEYFTHLFTAFGLPCDVAEGGSKALEMVRSNTDKPYNMFFIDWQMPEMDGIELTRRIKEITGGNAVVIMISVTEWSNIEKEALAAGVRTFIPKPLFPSSLLAVINECLGAEPEQAVSGGNDTAANPSRSFSNHTILIAEDVDVNREIMSAVFEDTGIIIEFAENGKEAVSMFREHPSKYGLILMDVHMPEMDGYEATRMIRALGLPQSKDIPIIAMTANVFRSDIDNCLSAGMNDHIGKPVDIEALFAKLAHYLPE